MWSDAASMIAKLAAELVEVFSARHAPRTENTHQLKRDQHVADTEKVIHRNLLDSGMRNNCHHSVVQRTNSPAGSQSITKNQLFAMVFFATLISLFRSSASFFRFFTVFSALVNLHV